MTISPGRSSHEERGLKCVVRLRLEAQLGGRSSHEERGLKFVLAGKGRHGRGRSSHEERGLKFPFFGDMIIGTIVAPRMRSVD